MTSELESFARQSPAQGLWGKIAAERKSLAILTLFVLIFFYKFFFMGYLYSPADILSHSYFPWITNAEAREQYPTNPFWSEVYKVADDLGIGPKLKSPSNYEVADVVFAGIPSTEFSVNEMKRGFSPVWNDHLFCGYNQYADITYSPYYPLNLVYFIPGISTMQATSIKIIISVYFLGVFFFFLLRDMGVSRFAATSASITLMYCMPIISFAIFISFTDAYMWLPLLVLLFRLYLRNGKGGHLILASFVACAMIFSRNPKPISYIFVFLGLYQLAHIFLFKEFALGFFEKLKRCTFYSLFVFCLGTAMSSVLTLPMFEAIKLGGRMEHQNAKMFLNFSNALEYITAATQTAPSTAVWQKIVLIGALFPKFFGAATDQKIWQPIAYVETTTYMGLLPLAFVIGTLFCRKNREEWFYLTFATAAFLVFLNQRFFYAAFCFFIPNSGIPRVMPLVVFCVAVLFAMAIDKILNAPKTPLHVRCMGSLLPFATLLVCGGVCWSIFGSNSYFYDLCRDWLYDFKAYPALVPTFPFTRAEFEDYHVKNFLIIGVISLLSLVFLVRPYLLRYKVAFLVVLFLQLAFISQNTLPTTKQRYAYPEVPTTRFLQENIGNYRIARMGARIVTPSGAMSMYGINDAMIATCSIAPPLLFGIYNALDPHSDTNLVTGVGGFTNAGVLKKRLLDAMAIKYVVSMSAQKELAAQKELFADMIHDLPQALIIQPAPDFVVPSVVPFLNDRINVIVANPPSSVHYTYTLPMQAVFNFGIALNPYCWQPDKGDGVTFEILINDGLSEKPLYRKSINPKSVVSDQKIFWETLDLSAYGGKKVTLKLGTTPDQSPIYDWAFWVNPTITGNLPAASGYTPAKRQHYKNVWASEGCFIYENTAVLPRAFLSFGAKPASSVDAKYEIPIPLFPTMDATSRRTLGMLVSDEYDPRRFIVVEEGKELTNNLGIPARAVVQKKIANYEYEYTTESEVESYLYIADTYDSGWYALIDGSPGKILKANHAFRAVYLPPGKHRVVMKYTPSGYVAGLVLSVFSFVILGAYSVYILMRRPDSR